MNSKCHIEHAISDPGARMTMMEGKEIEFGTDVIRIHAGTNNFD